MPVADDTGGSNGGSSGSGSSSSSADGLAAEELRNVLLGVMKAKDALEEELRVLKQHQSETSAAVAATQEGASVLEADRQQQSTELQATVTEQLGTMEALTKENGLLKTQLKKYVSETTLLKRQNKELTEKLEMLDADDGTARSGSISSSSGAGGDGAEAGREHSGSMSRSYSGLDHSMTETEEMALTIGQFESIEDMQAHHERQIIQLSEMHCEQMEMTDRMRDDIRQRDQLIVSLGGQPPAGAGFPGGPSSARGGGGVGGSVHRMKAPMGRRNPSAGALARPAKLANTNPGGIAMPGSNRPVIDIWIPSALLRGKGSDSHHVFQVYIRCGDDEWNVYRRFTHFSDLHQQVSRIFGKSKIALPKKKAFGKKDAKFVEERRQALELYTRQIIELCLSQAKSPLVQNPCKQTLCEAIPFLREKLTSRSEPASAGGGGGGGGGYSGF
jgi:sorting nexin-29